MTLSNFSLNLNYVNPISGSHSSLSFSFTTLITNCGYISSDWIIYLMFVYLIKLKA